MKSGEELNRTSCCRRLKRDNIMYREWMSVLLRVVDDFDFEGS